MTLLDRPEPSATTFLSRAEVAERIGVKPDTLGRYVLPPADAVIGRVRGWLPTTIDEWHASRPRPRKVPNPPPGLRRRNPRPVLMADPYGPDAP